MPRKKKLPKPNATHSSLKPDCSDKNKGSYFRRIEDIKKGLKDIDASSLPPGGGFLFLYYGCEKLGQGMSESGRSGRQRLLTTKGWN